MISILAETIMPANPIDGLLAIDKPGGITSRTAVDRVQHWFPRGMRIGHTGTLDPLATGVLVVCLGTATRLTEYVQHMGKTYRTTVRLGSISDTDDAEGCSTPVVDACEPSRAAIEECLRGFLGGIEQVPPAYSAARVTGRRAYDLARAGKEVILAPRRVRIDGIDVLRFEYPQLDLEIRCGKGTYIRSLARDLGQRLGCGGYVQMLRRTRVGPFRAEAALSLEVDPETARVGVLPLALAAAELPRVELSPFRQERFRQGQASSFESCRGWEAIAAGTEECAVFTPDGSFVAIGCLDWGERQVRPVKVMPV